MEDNENFMRLIEAAVALSRERNYPAYSVRLLAESVQPGGRFAPLNPPNGYKAEVTGVELMDKLESVEIAKEMLDAGMHEFMLHEVEESSPGEMVGKAFIAMISVYASNLERGTINHAPHQ